MKKGGLPKVAYLEMGIAILVPKVSYILFLIFYFLYKVVSYKKTCT